jgi:hypothetical protein
MTLRIKRLVFAIVFIIFISIKDYGQISIASFQPAISYVFEGQSGVLTVPVPLTVTLNTIAMTNQFIQIGSSNPSSLTVVGGGVTILAGQQSGVVYVDAIMQSVGVTLTASLNEQTLTTKVRVVSLSESPVLDSISPKTCVVNTSETKSFKAYINIPAVTGGIIISLAEIGGIGSLPSSITIPDGQIYASFNLTAASTESTGSIVGMLGSSSASAMVDVVLPLNNENVFQDTYNHVWLFPNPAKDHIIFNLNTPDRDAMLSILNSSGQMLYCKVVNGSPVYINLSDLKQGIYFVNISIGSKKIIKKLIVTN